MKKYISIIFISVFLLACENNYYKSNETGDCYNLTSIEGWTKINFKTNYTIQIPDGFEGIGMTGFEGNTFSKFSSDGKINLDYSYCNGLFCFDFGYTLVNILPGSIKIKLSSGSLITMDKIEFFRQNSDTVGALYYSDIDRARGRLFWKDDNVLKAALELDFNFSEFDTVKKIIGTIDRK